MTFFHINRMCGEHFATSPSGFHHLKPAEAGWLLLINGLMFESFLTHYIPATGFFDELVTILLVLNILIILARKQVTIKCVLYIYELLGLVVLALIVTIGLVGGYVSCVQLDIKPVIIDIFTCIKFPIALACGYIAFVNKRRLFTLLLGEVKIMILVMLPFAIMNQFIDIGMRYDFRYGLYSYQFIFGHPASLAAVVVGFLVLFFAQKKLDVRWLVLCWILLLSTLRSTAIVFTVFSILMCLFLKTNRRIGFGQIAAFVLVVACFGWSQIQYYFFNTDRTARSELLNAGLQIANHYFPLGSGFATFASNITASTEYYSSLYHRYELDSVYGLTIDDPRFLSDSFWPIILGQFGWIGTILFILMIVLLFAGCLSRSRICGYSILPFITGLGYLLLTSVSASAFFHPSAIFLAVCIAVALSWQMYTARESEEKLNG